VSSKLLDLKSLAENRTGFARNALFDRVAGLLFESEGELTDDVRTLIDQILTGLIHQVEADVRKKVACRLASLKSAPHELVKTLAGDEIDIASPLLFHSPVLSTQDLIEIINAKSPEHREAIAKRASIPAEVVQALVAAKEPRVIQTLLANVGAVIPRAIFNDLVALAESVDAIRRPLVDRRDFPKDLAHQMFWYVSAAMRQTILQRFSIDAAELDGIIAEVLNEPGLRITPQSQQRASTWSAGEVQALVAKARAGDIPGFTRALEIVTGVDAKTAARIVADLGGEPLAVACKAVGADKSQFTTIFMQLDFKRYGKARPMSFLEGVAKTYDILPQQKAKAMMKVWAAHGQKMAA
jgi:uncharacterized protein (DUF2336 family)